MSISILGQNVSLIRPCKIVKHSAQGAWKCIGESRKTIKLSFDEKRQVAALMGYQLTLDLDN